MNRWQELAHEVENTGFYPEFMLDSISVAVANEPVLGFLLNQEPAFEGEEIRRHATIVVLTQTRLVICHTDEQPEPHPTANAVTEAVRIDRLNSVVIQRTVGRPAAFGVGQPAVQEINITIGWGAVSRLDVGPAGCDDPKCEADHGFTGTAVNDDLTLRVSLAADGEVRLAQAWDFARVLSELSAGH